MKCSQVFEKEKDGFLGALYEAPEARGRCMVVLMGDDPEDLMNKAWARWFVKHQKISALCLGLRENKKQDPGISLWDLNQVQKAAEYVKQRGYLKIGILGMSMQAVIALSAAARIPEISLVLALSPCDYVPWGFCHGPVGKDKNAEYPTGESLLTWDGSPLPYQAAHMEKEAYSSLFQRESKNYKELHSRGIFDRSEELQAILPEAFIPAETIRGAIVLIGAEDDSMWNSVKYIVRMKRRLREKEFMFPATVYSYTYGTHLLVPQRMLMEALPLIGGLSVLLFASGRKHYKEAKEARIHLDRQLSSYLENW